MEPKNTQAVSWMVLFISEVNVNSKL